MVGTDRAAAATFFVHDWQARGVMLAEFTARFFNRLMPTATRRRRSHDLFDADFRSVPVIGRNATTHVAFGDDADQFEVLRILNHRCAAAA